MNKLILAGLLSAVTLASVQAGAADLGFVGAVEGAIVGSHIGGAHGAVAGALIGAAIGSSAETYDYPRSRADAPRFAHAGPARVYAPTPVYARERAYPRERVYASAPAYAYDEPYYEPYYEPAPVVYARPRAYPVYAPYPVYRAYPAYPVFYRTSGYANRYTGSHWGHHSYGIERHDHHWGRDRPRPR